MLEKKEFEKNEFMYRVSTMLTIVSGIFSFIVFVMLVINYLQIRQADPVDNTMLTEMRIEYAALPKEDAELAKRIQDLDLLTRKAYFTTQNHLRIGAILLLLGVSVFMIAFKNMTRWKPNLPELAEVPTAEKEFLALAEARNLISWGAVILLGGGMMASYFTESHLVTKVDGAQTVGGVDGTIIDEAVEIVKKEFPKWDAVQEQWPSFRGPGAYGVAKFANAPTSWDMEAGTNIKWKVEIPKWGTNSPVIWGNRLFISGADEEHREIYCYDTETGDLVWTRALTPFPGTPAEPLEVNEETGHAASTLAVHGDQVFAIFANADIASYDFDGNLIWGRNLGLPDNHYGHSSSLLSYEGNIFIQMDQNSEAKVIAIDAATGAEVWATPRDEISWASPIIAPTEFGPQLILASEMHVRAYDPADGTELWALECLGGEVAPSPAYSNGMVFVANEYAMANGIQIMAADAVELKWEYDDLLPEVSSPLGDGERFYFATSIGELVCLDAASGEELWLEELSDGFYSSPVLVGDKIYLLDMEGTMHIMRASATAEVIASVSLGEEETFATPAFMDKRIYIRTNEHLICIEGES
jgi:outer membrane protein assembly factor BamB